MGDPEVWELPSDVLEHLQHFGHPCKQRPKLRALSVRLTSCKARQGRPPEAQSCGSALAAQVVLAFRLLGTRLAVAVVNMR